MRISVDIVHPADFHFFRTPIAIWRELGHEVLVTSRKKDCVLELFDYHQIPHQCLTEIGKGLPGLLRELVVRDYRLFQLARRFVPDVFVSEPGISSCHVATVMRKPALVFYNNEMAKISNTISYPFATTIYTSDSYRGDLGARHVRYRGYHESSYLRPERFTPDLSIVDQLGLTGKRFSVVRFVAWGAAHDINDEGLSFQQKHELIEILKRHGEVIISSEQELPPSLASYRYRGEIGRFHHLLAAAQLVVGESATLTAEAALLGIPSVFVAKTDRGYTAQLEERYSLTRYFRPASFPAAVAHIEALLRDPETRPRFQERRQRMLDDTIDVAQFVVEAVLAAGQGRASSTAH